VSEFLKKITEARKKCWEDLSRAPGKGGAPGKAGKVHQREVTNAARGERQEKTSWCRELSQ